MKKISIFIFFIPFLFSLPKSEFLTSQYRQPYSPLPFSTGLEKIFLPVNTSLTFTTSPGILLSRTFIDYQSNGTLGSRIEFANNTWGFDWMHSPDSNSSYPNRYCYYNAYFDDTVQLGMGVQASGNYRAGYVTFGMFPDGKACCFFHHTREGVTYSALTIEIAPQTGIFGDPIEPDVNLSPYGHEIIWPHGTIGNNGIIHVLGYGRPPTAGASEDFYYSRSTDGGNTFTNWMPIMNDTVMACLSGDIYAQPNGDKVVIAYTSDLPEIHSQVLQNVWIRESYDRGATWQPPRQITNYPYPTDTLPHEFAYADCDAIYDLNGNLHVVWTEILSMVGSQGPATYPGFSRIRHWSEETGITLVSGIGHLQVVGDSWWYSPYPNVNNDAWRRPADRPQLAIDNYGNLYCVWVGNLDTNDISQGRRINGELYAAVSTDGGRTWGVKGRIGEVLNLTNSPSPGAPPGMCEDDDYFSLAPFAVDGYLHITYINDKDAGGVPQQEGVVTNNPVLYFRVPCSLLVEVGIAENNNKYSPKPNFFISPNPASKKINIIYSLPKSSPITIAIFDISGKMVEILENTTKEKGNYKLTWDAEGRKGTYFCLFNDGKKIYKKKIIIN
ncbi:MAG: T9SS type A sorting domain-containing protein [candidate division WOR-3 bacterium]